MKYEIENYKFLLSKYSLVNEYLANIPSKQEDIADVITSFCVVVEKIFKIKLYKQNPILVYDNSKFKDNDALVSILKEKEISMETIRIADVIDRYQLMFHDEFTDNEMQILVDIYKVRNNIIHGYKPDNVDVANSEILIKKMGTVWEKISAQTVLIFGEEVIKSNKPKKKYSEDQLEEVLIEEVKKKIQSTNNIHGPLDYFVGHDLRYNRALSDASLIYNPMSIGNEPCPRCGSYNFSLENFDSTFTPSSVIGINLYNTRSFPDYISAEHVI